MRIEQRLSVLPERADIVIVGAGLTGLCTALFLAHQPPTWKILLLDTGTSTDGAGEPGPDAAEESFGPRHIALSESSRRLFDRVGLWPPIADGAAAITEIRISDRGHAGHAVLSAAEQGLASYGHVVDATAFAAVLSQVVDRAPGIQRLFTEATVQPRPRTDGMTLLVGDQQTRAALVVLANGPASPQARRLGIGFKTKNYDRVALTATLTLVESHHGIAYERFTSEGPVALLPLPDRQGLPQASLVWSMAPDHAEVLRNASATECLKQLREVFGSRAGPFVAIEHRHVTPLTRTVALEQVRSHLVLVGSAAHSLHPVAGQGFNLSLRDIAVLAEVLAEEVTPAETPGALSRLHRYQRLRQDDQDRVMAFSDLLPSLFASTNPLVVSARNLGLLGIDLVPELGRGLARFGAGLMAGKGSRSVHS